MTAMVGLAVSMMFGYLTMNKTYNNTQIVCSISFSVILTHRNAKMAVMLVTSGVILATISGPSSTSRVRVADDVWQYSIGIFMLVLASLATGYYGTLQEKTYTRYGPHWREGVFYTVSKVSILILIIFNV